MPQRRVYIDDLQTAIERHRSYFGEEALPDAPDLIRQLERRDPRAVFTAKAIELLTGRRPTDQTVANLRKTIADQQVAAA